MVGGGKEGFSKDSWMKAFEHKDHGDQDDEVTTAFNCISAGGKLDFEKFKNISDYNSDGQVDQGDFVNMIHATI